MEIFVIDCILFASILTCGVAVNSHGYYEYDYSIRRNSLQEKERAFSGHQQVYTKDEQIVYNYLEYLKWEEFNKTKKDFPPARPVKLHLDDVKSSDVYKVLKAFPKGGNLHLHHNHVVSKSKILDLIYAHPLYDNLYVKEDEPSKWSLDFFLNPPPGWAKVKNNSSYSKKVLVEHSTLLGIMDDLAMNQPTNSGLRWSEMGPLFGVIGSRIINQANISKLHMEAMLEAAKDENVQYLETKVSAYSKLYVLDPSSAYLSKNGKRLIDNNFGELELNIVSDVVQEFKKNNPNFIGYKRIINSYRGNKKYMGKDIENALMLYQKYPNLISGFDLVSEEDKGYSLLFFLSDFANITAKNKSLPYFFHAGETNWPDDLLSSIHEDDPVAAMENIYDAILLGAKRVGHGIGFLNHPYLLEILKKGKIAIEANPVSNKMLGYVPDQRHHPAITYLRYGIPVVLGADDPSTFGYNEFTLDWYEAFMGWGLNLGDMRQLALNSLRFSSLSTMEKNVATSKWKNSWDTFVTNTKKTACALRFSKIMPHVSSIFPVEGHLNNATKIKVFGRNFRVAVCKQVFCRFGSEMTRAKLVYDHMLTCNSPQRIMPSSGNRLPPLKLPFTVSFDDGSTFLDTGIVFSYMHYETPLHISGSNIIGK